MTGEKVCVVTLGCSKNTVDSERLMAQITANRFGLTENPEEASTIIVNTCGFIDAAKEESVNTILEAVKVKEATGARIIVAGCLSERYKTDLQTDIPEVDGFFGTEDYENILKEIGGNLRYDLLGERVVTTPSHTAYLKISEGCSNPCSFCAIPLMRGTHVSRPMEELITETKSLANKGVKEIVVIGQDTTDYGIDIYNKRNAAELLHALSAIDGIEWIRLMYAYPSHFPDDLIDEIAKNPKICKYIDIPLQHIADSCLKSMRRGISKRRTIELLETLRSRIPGLVLRTTIIVGYPAEKKEEFAELCDFLTEFEFDRLGVFTYSIEENTSSFLLGDSVSRREKTRRKNKIMRIQQEISRKKNESMIGKKLIVLVESLENGFYIGRSYRDAPEVDGEVLIPSDKELQAGMMYPVVVYDCNDYDLFANLDV